MELNCSIADQINHLNSQSNCCLYQSMLEKQYAASTNVFSQFTTPSGIQAMLFHDRANALVYRLNEDGTIHSLIGKLPNKKIWKETNEYWIVIDHQVGKLKLLSIVWKDAHDPLKRIKLEE